MRNVVVTCSLTLLTMLFASGCKSATGNLVPPNLAANDPEAQLEFWHQMNDQKITSNDQAFHALLLFIDGKDEATDYAGRVAALKARKMLSSGFNQPGEQAVERGHVAVVIVRYLKIRGGLTMMVLGPIPRYAVRELIFMNLYPPGSSRQTFSGAEFVGIIGRVEDYQRGSVGGISAAAIPGR